MGLAGDKAYSVLLHALALAAAFFATFSDKGGHIVRMLPIFICIAALRALSPSKVTT